ncbi:GspH/FimT family pseudopilin [Collimonas humicola]|uniref:GspH/FimT family pseudopilin n=1 Tax=Collimonas humicola TaxID=2825886 RepID=UPI001B8BDB61|nr:GspH/FimT family pseudopilin [Collimonas humicola]
MKKSSLIRSQRGTTLIELMVALAVFATLLALAWPNFKSSIQNAQIRTAAESIVNGLQLTRAEAVRRNSEVQFQLNNTLAGAAVSGGTDWSIVPDDLSTPGTPNFSTAMQTRNGNDTVNARIGAKTAADFTSAAAAGANLPGNITFTGMGRLTAASTIVQIDVTNTTGTSARQLSITLTPGGQIRLCDPALTLAKNPQGCS